MLSVVVWTRLWPPLLTVKVKALESYFKIMFVVISSLVSPLQLITKDNHYGPSQMILTAVHQWGAPPALGSYSASRDQLSELMMKCCSTAAARHSPVRPDTPESRQHWPETMWTMWAGKEWDERDNMKPELEIEAWKIIYVQSSFEMTHTQMIWSPLKASS